MRRCAAILALLAGCGPVSPAGVQPAATPKFAAAQAVFQSACVRCHPDFGTLTEDDWRVNGRVVAGKPAESPVYRFLKGSQVGGPETMPRDGDLTDEQRGQIKAWIEALDGAAIGSPSFRAAAVVLANNCISCHSAGTGLPDFALPDEAAWVNSGFIVPGDPAGSYLLQRIAGAGLGGTAETMPFDRRPIRPDELAALSKWIRAIRR